MSESHSLIYGFIQALTEFLPVSSSGHLALLPMFLSFEDPGVAFDLAMHLGTAMAIVLYFFKDIIWIVKNKYILNYIVATIATASLVFFVKDLASNEARNSYFIAANLFIFGWILYFCDKKQIDKDESFKQKLYIKESIIIGLSQVLAVFPGVSRSGITISAGRLLGFDKKTASAFSFLLSVPLILGGAVLKYKDMSASIDYTVTSLILGTSISFFLGLVVIHYFLKLIKKVNFIYFAIYRTLLAVAILYFIAR